MSSGSSSSSGSSGDGSSGTGDPLVWEAAVWGIASAVSLNIGSVIGVTCLPPKKVCAILMSFGGGALLFALSIELFGHTLHLAERDGSNDAVWIMEGAAICGGCLFAGLNRVLNSKGADIRKPSLEKVRFNRLRGLLVHRIIKRMQKLKLFSELTTEEVNDLVFSNMYKKRFSAGAAILEPSQAELNLYFIVSGTVEFEVLEDPDDPNEEDEETKPGDELSDFGGQEDARSPVHPCREESRSTDVTKVGSTVHHKVLDIFKLGPDEIFGEMFLRRAIALTTTKLLVLPANALIDLIDRKESVRLGMVVRMLERVRRGNSLPPLPSESIQMLSTRVTLQTYQADTVILRGMMTSMLCVGLGSIDVCQEGAQRLILRASQMLRAEDLHFPDRSVKVVSLEPCTILKVEQDDMPLLCKHQKDEITEVGPHGRSSLTFESDEKVTESRCFVRISHQTEDEPSPRVPVVQVSQIARCEDPKAAWAVPGAPDAPESPKTPKSQTNNSTIVQIQPSLNTLLVQGDKIAKTPSDPSNSPNGVSSVRFVESTKGAKAGGASEIGVRQGSKTSSEKLNELIADDDLEDLQTFQRRRPDEVAVPARDGRRMSTRRQSVTRVDTVAETVETELPAATAAHELSSEVTRLDSNSPSMVTRLASKAVLPSMISQNMVEAGMHSGEGHEESSHVAIMVWLGILIDAIPESVVIGILINKSNGAASAVLPFIMGVFLSNLPESMSSAGMMKTHGMKVSTILLMWLTITILTGIGAVVGALAFPPGSGDDPNTLLIVSGVEGLAAGAMLTMIAQTMMPEAFGQGGDVVGLSCLVGFLAALSMKLLPS